MVFLEVNAKKIKISLLFVGIIFGWVSILGFLFSRPNEIFWDYYKSISPYAYTASLLFTYIVYFLFKNKDVSKWLSVCLFVLLTALCVCGVLLGMLMTAAAAGMTHVPSSYKFYGGYYFISAIVFYLAIFNENKEVVGLGSKIIYWVMLFLGLSVMIAYVAFS